MRSCREPSGDNMFTLFRGLSLNALKIAPEGLGQVSDKLTGAACTIM